MSIILNRFNNDVKKQLIEVITKADEELRRVTYYGLADGYIRVYIQDIDFTQNKPTLILDLKQVVKSIAELTIVDRDLLEHAFRSRFDYWYEMSMRKFFSNPHSWNNLLDSFNITKVLSENDIKVIEDNFSLYKEAYIAGNDYFMHEKLERLKTKA